MPGEVVVDASIAIRWFVPNDPLHGPAVALGDTWARNGVHPCAPSLIVYETANVAFQRFRAGHATLEAAQALVDQLQSAGIDLFEPADLAATSLRMAETCGLRATYDAFYLALADRLGCECWTADQRLHRAASPHVERLRLLGI